MFGLGAIIHLIALMLSLPAYLSMVHSLELAKVPPPEPLSLCHPCPRALKCFRDVSRNVPKIAPMKETTL